MPSATERRIAELTRGMLRLKLFVIFSYGKGLDLKPYLADHLAYMEAEVGRSHSGCRRHLASPFLSQGAGMASHDLQDVVEYILRES